MEIKVNYNLVIKLNNIKFTNVYLSITITNQRGY